MSELDGGAIIADVLRENGVRFLFTLCGGHISPILVGSKARGIKVVDVRDERNAVFAADAVARMTGVPGVAAVTAGPGVTNAITALKNAQMAQTPMILFGGATATLLKGRGSLQDIDQLSIIKPMTKWATTLKTVGSLAPTVRKAFEIAREGVPGPVFIEVPVDLLYPESIVREWYMKESGVQNADTIGKRALELYLKGHLLRQFHAPHINLELPLPKQPTWRRAGQLKDAAERLKRAERPVLVIGSQALANVDEPALLIKAVETLGIPTYLGGSARGLLGRKSPIQFRHKRSKALRACDLAIIAGFPFDFRLGYGRSISSKADVIAANLDAAALRKNRKPELGFVQHPGEFLQALAQLAGSTGDRAEWFRTLSVTEKARDLEIAEQAQAEAELINPLFFFQRLEQHLADDAVLVVDGGDFVATGSYVLRPRQPMNWLDPGVFGTLGVGGGFAVGAALCRPRAEVWLIYGDGSSAYSLAEFDTCVRHGLAPIAVVGSDGAWAQIAREQVEILNDDVGTVLLRTPYHKVAEGYGGVGLNIDRHDQVDDAIAEAKKLSKQGKPVLLNVQISASDFRKGSLSM